MSYYWLSTEVALLREVYPRGGVVAAREVLPGRSDGAIYYQASVLGLVREGKYERVKLRVSRGELDRRLRRVCEDGGDIEGLGREVGARASWLRRRAYELGFGRPARRERPWCEEELDVLRECIGEHPKTIRRKLLEAGFVRTEGACAVKRKRWSGVEKDDRPGYTAAGLARLFGVSHDTVLRWASGGLLKVERYGGGGNGDWCVGPRVVRKFVRENPHRIDLRRVTDQGEFLWLLLEG